jgi:glycogen debranching enzyme
MKTPAAGPTLDLPMVGEVERLVRTHGTLFLVTDRQGDITPPGARELGMFHQDTRHLSHYALVIEGAQTVRLSAETLHDAYDQIDLMLTDVEGEFLDDPKNFLHIRRRQLLDGGLIEETSFTNFLPRPVTLRATFLFGADFADIFEVRGAHRAQRGRYASPGVDTDGVLLAYEGLCGVRYETLVAFGSRPTEIAPDRATFELVIAPGQDVRLETRVVPMRDGRRRFKRQAFAARIGRLGRSAESFRARSTAWSCDDGLLQSVLDQSGMDLYAMRIRIPSPDAYDRIVGHQTILGAGIPWFCAPFGRDALITAYEALTLNPEFAIESLRALAAYQGGKFDDEHEEEPGKIHHELRFGEMARCGEIPHSPYYGCVDATPLFVVLAGALFDTVVAQDALHELRPHIERALSWIDVRSEEGSRFVTYQKRTKQGLDNQGWKDSRAGVSFPDGRRAEPPIALCEVQGYCVDAYARAARLYRALGDESRSKTYAERAARLREKIETELWLPEAGRYAFAIEGSGRVLPTIVSNAGHLLWSRVPTWDRAAATGRLLLGSSMFSGFGVRTLGDHQRVYNPLSYHNGTVWPHDNAIVADGLAQYGLYPEVAKIFDGLHRAMSYFRDRRIPELFCGIDRRSGPLVRYPVAGSPQAWSAAAPFLLLQAMLGLRPDAPARRLVICNPQLPEWLRRVEFRNMRVGDALVSMRFRRVSGRCHVDRLDVTGGPLKTEIEMD